MNGRVEWMKCFKRLDWNAFKRLRWRLSKVGEVWLVWIACLQFEDWGSGRLQFTWQKICYWNNWVQSGYTRNVDKYLTSFSYVRLTDFTHCDLVTNVYTKHSRIFCYGIWSSIQPFQPHLITSWQLFKDYNFHAFFLFLRITFDSFH